MKKSARRNSQGRQHSYPKFTAGSPVWPKAAVVPAIDGRTLPIVIPSPDIKRVLRRHADLLDFLTRTAFAAPRWLADAERRVQLQKQATAAS